MFTYLVAMLCERPLAARPRGPTSSIVCRGRNVGMEVIDRANSDNSGELDTAAAGIVLYTK